MKKLIGSCWSRRIATVTIGCFVTLIFAPGPFPSPGGPNPPAGGRAEAAATKGFSVYLLHLVDNTQHPDVAARVEAELRNRFSLAPDLELLTVSRDHPLVRRALNETPPRITDAEVDNPPLDPQDLAKAADFAKRLGVDAVLVGTLEKYTLSEDGEDLSLDLRLDRYDLATFDPQAPQSRPFLINARKTSAGRVELSVLEDQTIEALAQRALIAVAGRPIEQPKPKVEKKKSDLLPWLAALVGILVLANSGRGKGGGAGPEVTNVTATATRSSVILQWTPLGANRATGYRIWRKVVRQLALRSRQGDDFVVLAEVPGGDSNSYTDTTAIPGYLYAYQVQPLRASGAAGRRVPEGGVLAGPSFASAPTGFRAEPGDGFVTLTWDPLDAATLSEIDGYRLYRRTGGGAEQLIATLPATATQYTDTNVVNGTSYTYRLVPFVDVDVQFQSRASILEGNSATVTVTPTARPPIAPRGLTAEPGDAEVVLRWLANPEADIDHYEVWRSQAGSASRGLTLSRSSHDLFGGKANRPGKAGPAAGRQGGTFIKVGEAPATPSPSFIDTSVANNLTYTYYVIAVDRSGGRSGPSNQVVVTPNAPPPIPQGVDAVGGNQQVTVSWLRLEGVPDLAGYNVYRSPVPIVATSPRNAVGVTKLNLQLLPPTQNQYLDRPLTNNRTFYYAVTAVDQFGAESNFSAVRMATPHVAPAAVALTANPRTISANGLALSTLAATITDANQNPVGGVRVVFTTTEGSVFPGDTTPDPNILGGKTVTVQSDSQGVATALLRAKRSTVADVSATLTAEVPEIVSGRNTATTVVLMKASQAASITVTAEPSSLVADRAATATITARVLDALGNPVPDGTEVEFSLPAQAEANLGASLGAGTAAPVPGQLVVTDTTLNGEARATFLAGGQAGTVVVTATVRAANRSGRTTLRLTVGPPARIAELKASPTKIPADGSTPSTITAKVVDAEGNPVANGTVVRFTTTLGTISSTATTTNGIATAVLTPGQETGVADVVASVDGVSESIQVEITAGQASQIVVVAERDEIPADGRTQVRITATVLDPGGNPVDVNTAVSFTTTLGTITPSAATDVNGNAQAVLTSSTTAGVATVTVASAGAVGTVNVKYLPGEPDNIVLEAELDALPADGISTTRLTARVEDANGNPVRDGTPVQFQVVGGEARVTASATTLNGVATAVLTAGTTVGIVRIKASVSTATRVLEKEVQVRLTAPVPGQITLTLQPDTVSVSRIDALGNRTPLNEFLTNVTEITAQVRDSNGRLLSGARIVLTSTDGNAVFEDNGLPSREAETDSRGIARIGGENGPLPRLVASTQAGTVTVSASDVTGHVTGSANLTVLPGPPAEGKMTLTANPREISRNGTSTSTLTAVVRDENNNPVQNGTQVIFSTTAGRIANPVQITTNGVAVATLTSDTRSAEAIVKAVAGTVSATDRVIFSDILPELARVVVQPSTLPGDGLSTAQITATVTNRNGVAVPDGTVVQFSTVKRGTNTPGAGRILNPTSTVNGRATATLQSTIVVQRESIEVVASVDGVELGRAPVTFTGGLGNITLIANPSVLPADGTSTSTITAIVTDQNGNPQAGQIVSFATTAGSIRANPGPSGLLGETNASGVATAVLTSSPQVGDVYVSAATGSLQQETLVLFQAGPPAVIKLTVARATANPKLGPLEALADGFDSFNLVAEVIDAFNNPVSEGTPVTFTATSAAGLPLPTIRPTTATVKRDPITGKALATATMTSTVKDSVTVTASPTGTTISDRKQVSFLAGPPSVVRVTVINPPDIPADGVSTTTLEFEVRDANNNLVEDGTRVNFDTDLGTVEALRPVGALNTGETHNGVVRAKLRSGTQSGTATVTATVKNEAGEQIASGEATVVFTPKTNLTIRLTASPLNIVADGVSQSTISATVTDANTNAPVAAGTLVSFTTTLGTVTPSGTTDSAGRVTATLTSSTQAGVATVTASTSGASPRTVQVTFDPGTVASIRVSSNKTNITADGSDNATITGEALDASGNVVPGLPLSFSSTSQVAGTTQLLIDGSDAAVTRTTDSTGRASTTITGTRAQTVILAVASGTVTGTVQLTLDPGPPTQVTVTPNPASIRADGVSTSRIRAQVQDAFGNNVANGTRVSFETTAGKIQADQPDPSDPTQKTGRTVNGVATATLTSSTTANTVATVTVRAVQTGAIGTAQVNFTPGPPASVDATASPEAISITFTGGAQNSATITAVVRDSTGQAVPNGTTVEFRTTLGDFGAGATVTTATTVNGIAQVRLNSGTVAGTATVTATALDASGKPLVGDSLEVKFIPGPPATVTLNVNPANIVADGKSTSTITAVVRDAENNNVSDGTVVTITVSGGTLPTIPPDEPDQDPAANGYQVKTVNGVAKATLTSSTEAGRETITAAAGTAAANAEITFSSDVPANITLGWNPPLTYTPSIWADNQSTQQVTAQVTTKTGEPVSDGTTIKFRILDKATRRTDGLVNPGTTTTVNGRATTTITASDRAGIHLIRAEVYDSQGNVVLDAEREIYFSGNVHQITLETSYNYYGNMPPGNSRAYPRLRFRSSYVVGVGEIFPHGDPTLTYTCGADPLDNAMWQDLDNPDDFIAYRAQVLDQNGLPVPDGTTVVFSSGFDLSVTSATTTNGWTTLPPGWTGQVTEGDQCVCAELRATVFRGLGTPIDVSTYQILGSLHTQNCPP
jgi:hypothetical protein